MAFGVAGATALRPQAVYHECPLNRDSRQLTSERSYTTKTHCGAGWPAATEFGNINLASLAGLFEQREKLGPVLVASRPRPRWSTVGDHENWPRGIGGGVCFNKRRDARATWIPTPVPKPSSVASKPWMCTTTRAKRTKFEARLPVASRFRNWAITKAAIPVYRGLFPVAPTPFMENDSLDSWSACYEDRQ
jgi:hypothetical protein